MKSFALIFLCLFSFVQAQKKDGCKSSEMESYDKTQQQKWKNYKFEPISKDETLKAPFDFIKIEFLYQPAKLENDIDTISLEMEKYSHLMFSNFDNDIEDKKVKKDKKQIKKEAENQADNFTKYMKIEDSLRRVAASKKIGPISMPKVIKSEQHGDKWAILYYDFKYDELLRFGSGYWLAFSDNGGKSWNLQYTGLSEKNNFVFKKNSKLPLWKDENHIQIESDIVRMIDPMGHPVPPEYELVRDNALVIMDIEEIMKDTDKDGINDITERKLFLNPNSSDTDNDGFSDNEDTNPRFRSKTSEFTILYEGLLYGNYELKGKGFFEEFEIDLQHPQLVKTEEMVQKMNESEMDLLAMDDVFSTISMIVTDDENLQQINPPDEKIIILTKKEYEDYKKQNASQIIQKNISPLFKCDSSKDTYLLRTSASYSGQTYKIIRTKKGWKVKTISSWIS